MQKLKLPKLIQIGKTSACAVSSLLHRADKLGAGYADHKCQHQSQNGSNDHIHADGASVTTDRQAHSVLE